MAVHIKKIGRRDYLYLVYRAGDRVVQKYIGPLADPAIRAKMEDLKRGRRVPEKFAYLFWDVHPESIDLRKNARFVIERVLDMGDLKALKWLQRVYSSGTIIEVLETSRRVSRKTRNFFEVWFHAP